MLLALCDYRSLDRSVVVLNKAHLDVSRLLIWWNALSVAEKNSKANANRLVSVTENAAVAEAQILLGGHGGLGLLDDGAQSSPLLVPAPAVSWPWVPAWGSLEPPRRE